MTIAEMLTYKRPAGSQSEREFIARYIDCIPGMQRDRAGNRFLSIGQSPTTMIACHTDTVHSSGGRQRVVSEDGTFRLADRKPKRARRKRKDGRRQTFERDCLGADDAAGVYAALGMIEAGVPALYVFHRAEEQGGIGSAWIADYRPQFLDGIERCVSLDRRGTEDIITHQAFGRCASDEFALALAAALEMCHEPSDLGSFTDSANYADLVPECTNISVGYYREHSPHETLDANYLDELTMRLCEIDWDSLPVVREPGEDDFWLAQDDAPKYDDDDGEETLDAEIVSLLKDFSMEDQSR